MKAVVLCAGYGTRLGDLTREMPKPMLMLGGQPLLAWLLGNLRAQGFREIAINLHFKPSIIRDWFGDGERWGLKLTYSHEEQLLGTAGALRNLRSFLDDQEEFLVQYGDVLTDQNISELVEQHRSRRGLATLLLHQRARSNSIVSMTSAGQISGFLERPNDEARRGVESPWVNSGLCVCSHEILDAIPAGRPSDLPRDVFIHQVKSGRLYGVPLSGFRCAIDSPQRLEEARTAITQGQCRIPPLQRTTSDPEGAV